MQQCSNVSQSHADITYFGHHAPAKPPTGHHVPFQIDTPHSTNAIMRQPSFPNYTSRMAWHPELLLSHSKWQQLS
jgi:hypothetical protein